MINVHTTVTTTDAKINKLLGKDAVGKVVYTGTNPPTGWVFVAFPTVGTVLLNMQDVSEYIEPIEQYTARCGTNIEAWAKLINYQENYLTADLLQIFKNVVINESR